VGVFFQKDLFTGSWGSLAEPLRVRSYRLYCDARKLAGVPALTLLEFNTRERRLRRAYADVLASREASAQVELMEGVLAEARAQLRASVRPKGTD
jgi:hypothetical protein